MVLLVILTILMQGIVSSDVIHNKTGIISCGEPFNFTLFSQTNLTSPSFVNIAMTVNSGERNLIMKVYTEQDAKRSYEYYFENSNTSDSSLVDFSSLFLHSKSQYISIAQPQFFSVFIYQFNTDKLEYENLDSQISTSCTTTTYTLIITSSQEIEGPGCRNGGKMMDNGICDCQDSYAMNYCEIQYLYLSEAGNYKKIRPGETHYFYYKIIGSIPEMLLSLNFQSNQQTNILTYIQQSQFPSTIACVFNQNRPSIDQFSVKKDQLLLITVYQPQNAKQSYYSIWISLAPNESLLLILLLSLAGFFFLVISGACIFYCVNKSGIKKRNEVVNIIICYDSIFPPITYEVFLKFIGQPGHQNCVICLQDFQLKSEVKYTICGHILHGKCLDGWLNREENCPLCRQEFSDQNLGNWEQKMQIDFEDQYQKYKKRAQKEKKKRKNSKIIEHNETLYSLRKNKNMQMESNLATKSQNVKLSNMEQYAITIYSLIYKYHKRVRHQEISLSGKVQDLIFELPNSNESKNMPEGKKKEFRTSSRRVSENMTHQRNPSKEIRKDTINLHELEQEDRMD